MMHTFPVTRALVALLATMGVTATTAQVASARQDDHGHHARRLHRTGGHANLLVRGLHVDFSDDGLEVTASVANTGRKLAKPTDTVIALSTDKALDENDEILDDASLTGLMPGASKALDDDVEVPDDLPDGQDLYLLVCADGDGDVAESDETDNCASQLIASDDLASAAGNSDDSNDDDDSGDDDHSRDVTGSIVLTDGQ